MSYTAIRACKSCGSKNRVPASHLADRGKCGACKTALPPLDEPLEADQNSFDEIVREAKVPVLTDFWASWCGPCVAAAPEVHALAQEMAGKLVVLKVNTEENPGLAARYRIQSIPNFVVLRNGQVVLQRAGFGGRAELRRWLEQA
jgi:thioredoxin 2